MAEIAAQIQKDIEEFSSLLKFDQFIKLASFYHVELCENDDCINCMFVINLRYLYIEQITLKSNSVDSLQKYCKEKFANFYSLRHFLRTLGEIEKKEYYLTLNLVRYWRYEPNHR